MIVTAPTGVAAINAGGVTLHSFFQLPFGPFVPGGEAERQAAAHRLSRQKREIIQSLDLLVIDEISMVRCDLLDAVDFVLRRQRGSERPFGGVQLLMIGDLHQLAPVVRDDDWAILRDFYDSGFSSAAGRCRRPDMVPIALEHIYRQSDADFIELLNRVRDSRLDEATLERLNSRHLPDFKPNDGGRLDHADHAQPRRRSDQRGAPARPRRQAPQLHGAHRGRLPRAQLSHRRDADPQAGRPGHVRAQRQFRGQALLQRQDRHRDSAGARAHRRALPGDRDEPPPKPRSRSSRSPGRTSSTASTRTPNRSPRRSSAASSSTRCASPGPSPFTRARG
jgi:hypothetical protein